MSKEKTYYSPSANFLFHAIRKNPKSEKDEDTTIKIKFNMISPYVVKDNGRVYGGSYFKTADKETQDAIENHRMFTKTPQHGSSVTKVWLLGEDEVLPEAKPPDTRRMISESSNVEVKELRSNLNATKETIHRLEKEMTELRKFNQELLQNKAVVEAIKKDKKGTKDETLKVN